MGDALASCSGFTTFIWQKPVKVSGLQNNSTSTQKKKRGGNKDGDSDVDEGGGGDLRKNFKKSSRPVRSSAGKGKGVDIQNNGSSSRPSKTKTRK